jgi:hypothetical protein
MKPYNYLTQNSKMRKTGKKRGVRVFNWGIPAFKAANGFKTCPSAGACVVGCYAKAGAYLFSNVAKVFEKRLDLTFKPEFQATIIAEIKRRKVDVLRIHDSGDFYSPEYFLKWADIMKACPDVKFYAYSKQVRAFKTFKAFKALPSNFVLIFSFGGLQDTLIDVKTDRHAAVFRTLDELNAAGYVDASNDDLNALGVNPRVGLVYHGTKNFKNTAWDRADKKRKAG